MSDKKNRSSSSEDENFRHLLGKVDKLKLMEPLYLKALKENRSLKARLAAYEASGGTEAAANVRRSDSITQLLLKATDARNLEHPTEFFEFLEKEKREEIELLKKKCQNSDKELKTVQQQIDDLQHQVEGLKSSMKVLEDKHPSSSSWEYIEPRFNLTEREFDEPETVALRRKIDELQNRVKELLNHNEKWNAYCKELQDELDAVRSELQEYHKAEACDQATLMADLKDQKVKTEEAEKIAHSARKHIEELEEKISELERQLQEKEQLERPQAEQAKETIRVLAEEDVKTQAFVYEVQMKAYQEDFERERQEHEKTKNQLESMRKQWKTLHAELLIKNEQLNDKTKQLEDKEKENKSLQEQLKEALGDQCLIRKRANEFQCGSPAPSEWTCNKCTLINKRNFVKCAACETPREGEKTPEVVVVKKPPKMQGQLEEDGVCIEKSKWHCNKCTFRNAENVSSCIMCANPPASHSSVM